MNRSEKVPFRTPESPSPTQIAAATLEKLSAKDRKWIPVEEYANPNGFIERPEDAILTGFRTTLLTPDRNRFSITFRRFEGSDKNPSPRMWVEVKRSSSDDLCYIIEIPTMPDESTSETEEGKVMKGAEELFSRLYDEVYKPHREKQTLILGRLRDGFQNGILFDRKPNRFKKDIL